MANHTNRWYSNTRSVFSAVLLAALAVTGCGTNTSQSPPKQMVEDTLRASLPPFLSFDSSELESISTGPETVKVNFKATVTPKEDLCQVDREVQGTPKVTLLKVVQATGTKASLYGSVEAHRTLDKWTLESPQIQTGLEQFGKPRGAFDAHSFASGTDEANAALRQQAENAQIQQRAKEAAEKQQELDRIAREERQAREDKARKEREEKAKIAFEEQRAREAEQRKKDEQQRKEEEEAALQKLMLATAPGTRYTGTVSQNDRFQHIRWVFTEQNNLLIRAEANNPDRPKTRQVFAGQLVLNPKPEEGSTFGAYSIVMSPVGRGENDPNENPSFGEFYDRDNGSLKLRLTEKGLEGEALISGDHYTLHLQQGDSAASKPASKQKSRRNLN